MEEIQEQIVQLINQYEGHKSDSERESSAAFLRGNFDRQIREGTKKQVYGEIIRDLTRISLFIKSKDQTIKPNGE